MGTQDIHRYTGYIGVYRIYSTTKVNMGIQGYTCYAGIITYRTNILGSLYGDCRRFENRAQIT